MSRSPNVPAVETLGGEIHSGEEKYRGPRGCVPLSGAAALHRFGFPFIDSGFEQEQNKSMSSIFFRDRITLKIGHLRIFISSCSSMAKWQSSLVK